MAPRVVGVYILTQSRICEVVNHRTLFNDPERTAWTN